MFFSLGNIAGLFIVSGAAALGLGAVLKASTLLFATVKIIGGIYLIYLGIRQWNVTSNVFNKEIEPVNNHQQKGKAFIQGMLVAISNPKAILFFTALFPQFIDLTKPVVIQFFVLTITFMVYSFIILVGYAVGARSVKDWFAKGNRAMWFDRISGTIFIAFGLGILRLRNRAT